MSIELRWGLEKTYSFKASKLKICQLAWLRKMPLLFIILKPEQVRMPQQLGPEETNSCCLYPHSSKNSVLRFDEYQYKADQKEYIEDTVTVHVDNLLSWDKNSVLLQLDMCIRSDKFCNIDITSSMRCGLVLVKDTGYKLQCSSIPMRYLKNCDQSPIGW